MNTLEYKARNEHDLHVLCDICKEYKCDIDAMQGNRIVDAKSILGLYTLNICNTITLKLHGSDADVDSIKRRLFI